MQLACGNLMRGNELGETNRRGILEGEMCLSAGCFRAPKRGEICDNEQAHETDEMVADTQILLSICCSSSCKRQIGVRAAYLLMSPARRSLTEMEASDNELHQRTAVPASAFLSRPVQD